MRFLCYLLGLFMVFPIKIFDIFGFNYKVDEFLLVFLAALFLCARTIRFVSLVCCFVVIFYLCYGVMVSFNGEFSIGYEVSFRLLQIVLVIVVVSMMTDVERTLMFDGIASWGPVFALWMVCYLIFRLDYSVGNLLQDQQYYKNFFNRENTFLSVHINTVGTILLLSTYINLLRYRATGNKVYLLLCVFMLLPSLMLFSKGDLLAVIVAGAFLLFAKIRLSSLFFVLGATIVLSVWDLSSFDPTREVLYGTAYNAFIKNPLGYGLGTESQVIFSLSGIDYPAHNFLLSAAIEVGVVGLMFFVALIIFCYQRSRSLMARAFLIAFVVVGSFGNVMYFYKYHFVFFIIVAAYFDEAYCRSIMLRSRKLTVADVN